MQEKNDNEPTKTKRDYLYTGQGTQVQTIKSRAENKTQVIDVKKRTQEVKLKMLTTDQVDFKIKQETQEMTYSPWKKKRWEFYTFEVTVGKNPECCTCVVSHESAGDAADWNHESLFGQNIQLSHM